MYQELADFLSRPEPFSRYTAKMLWTRPHLAEQMLKYHLDQETELASRPLQTIDQSVAYLEGQLGFAGQTLCDLGCGPGLYAQRFANLGAKVTGVDFSAHTLGYAQAQATASALPIRYLQADYLHDPLPHGFDLITLIYCDLCALSPDQRHSLLQRMRRMLNPGGRIVLDLLTTAAFDAQQEVLQLEQGLMGGFWSAAPYVGGHKRTLYRDHALVLDRYLIVEPEERWQIFNWLQHFTPAMLERELAAAGFAVEQLRGSLTGEPWSVESPSMAVIAKAL
uniref:Methyltransferase domain-containing protein n=1 Tax=Magnetococcus massalia (strain MO-1) TaxID=451514 RepID=A0A1S7LHJ6_MAGMO|nr:conserved protein of unknown function [Candidatus Magnetococcus massalia]